MESCDPGQHTVSVLMGCASLSNLYLMDSESGHTLASDPLVLVCSIKDRCDVRVHGPPSHSSHSLSRPASDTSTPDHLTGMPPVVRQFEQSRTVLCRPEPRSAPGSPDSACWRRLWLPAQDRTEREIVELIVRDGPQARAIRAESEVTRREQLARLVSESRRDVQPRRRWLHRILAGGAVAAAFRSA